MSQYKMTLNGLEALATSNEGDSIFKDISLPEGIEKDMLIATIYQRANEFEVLYADPEYMRGAVKNFFDRYEETFVRWQEAAESEYDPIENYNRHETYTGSDSGSGSGGTSTTDTYKKAGYNNSSFENYDQTTGSGSSNSQFSNSNSHTSHIHGNIGVTTSVKMLQEHVDFWKDFNLYDAIADLFVTQFCLLVY